MQTQILPMVPVEAIRAAMAILQGGGLVAFPTDTVYGLGASAFDGKAVESIYAAKDRPVEKAIPILVAGAEDLWRVAAEIPEMALVLAARYWPGPITLVLPKRAGLPETISATPTVGVRVPAHAGARRLLKEAGPLAVTSANLSGKKSPREAQEVLEQLGGRIALILDGGTTPGGIPSTVVDCLGPEPRILREGPITSLEIAQTLGRG